MIREVEFGCDQITDQKRLARGEQLLYARRRLRIRDMAHNKAWRILMLSGGAPSGEINAIRDLMPKAHITALDKNTSCLEHAIEAGADDILDHDLSDKWIFGKPKGSLRESLAFDLVDFDLCANVNNDSKELVRINQRLVKYNGIFILTFSYGRDVGEVFDETFQANRHYHATCEAKNEWNRRPYDRIGELLTKGVSESLCGRILWMMPTDGLGNARVALRWLHSVIVYRGNKMPMCSLLFQPSVKASTTSVLLIEKGDFELAALNEYDPTKIYDCPESRITGLRRSHAAFKAWLTMRQKSSEQSAQLEL